MRVLHFHPVALVEVEQAATFYKEQQSGLEVRFLDALEDVLLRIVKHPQSYRKVEGDVRKCKLLRFPYGVIFREHGNDIQVIAVMHFKRDPGYWQTRT